MGKQSRLNPFAGKKKQDPIIPTAAYDRMGRQLHPGDQVYILGKDDVFWEITAVDPVLDPGAPPGAMRISFVAQFRPMVPGGQRILDVITIGVAAPPEDEAAPAPSAGEEPGVEILDGGAIAEAEAVGTETPGPLGPRRVE